jgi:hypothetical protein
MTFVWNSAIGNSFAPQLSENVWSIGSIRPSARVLLIRIQVCRSKNTTFIDIVHLRTPLRKSFLNRPNVYNMGPQTHGGWLGPFLGMQHYGTATVKECYIMEPCCIVEPTFHSTLYFNENL